MAVAIAAKQIIVDGMRVVVAAGQAGTTIDALADSMQQVTSIMRGTSRKRATISTRKSSGSTARSATWRA